MRRNDVLTLLDCVCVCVLSSLLSLLEQQTRHGSTGMHFDSLSSSLFLGATCTIMLFADPTCSFEVKQVDRYRRQSREVCSKVDKNIRSQIAVICLRFLISIGFPKGFCRKDQVLR
jgi:hypothetical protein